MSKELRSSSLYEPTAPTVRDILAILFRQKWIASVGFGVIFAATLTFFLVRPRYQGEMKFLVVRERVDAMVTPGVQPALVHLDVTEEELNSEAEVLRSLDLLRSTARMLGPGAASPDAKEPAEDLEERARILGRRLAVEPLRRTNLIRVSYRARTPEEAEKVLQILSRLYLEKHIKVHRPPGSTSFFEQQAQRYREELDRAEQARLEASLSAGIVAAATERDLLLQKSLDFEVSGRQADVSIAETEQRINSLQQKMQDLPPRETTQVRVSDNAYLQQQLKATLLQLVLKRTQLLTKFQPTYRLVQEVDEQIASTKASIAAEDLRPLREEVTDKEPNRTWASSELLRTEVELEALRKRSGAAGAAAVQYRDAAIRQEREAIRQEDLMRAAKIAEENYVLYQRKREEARISDALDQRGLLNVTLAELPVAPITPQWAVTTICLLGLLAGGTTSVTAAFVSDRLALTYRTPAEVARELGAPVLAWLPDVGQTPWLNELPENESREMAE
jgi:uncharacterized protein involved in exopolysaccharide biosynthesis